MGTEHDCHGTGSPTQGIYNRKTEIVKTSHRHRRCDRNPNGRTLRRVVSRPSFGRGGRHEWNNVRRHGYLDISSR